MLNRPLWFASSNTTWPHPDQTLQSVNGYKPLELVNAFLYNHTKVTTLVCVGPRDMAASYNITTNINHIHARCMHATFYSQQRDQGWWKHKNDGEAMGVNRTQKSW